MKPSAETTCGAAPGVTSSRARLGMGGPEQLKEELRDARGTRWVEDWLHDLRFALRGMARAPGFTAAAVLTLALGLGANTAVWSVLDALLLRVLPLDRPAELHVVRRGTDTRFAGLFSHPLRERLQAAMPELAVSW